MTSSWSNLKLNLFMNSEEISLLWKETIVFILFNFSFKRGEVDEKFYVFIYIGMYVSLSCEKYYYSSLLGKSLH